MQISTHFRPSAPGAWTNQNFHKLLKITPPRLGPGNTDWDFASWLALLKLHIKIQLVCWIRWAGDYKLLWLWPYSWLRELLKWQAIVCGLIKAQSAAEKTLLMTWRGRHVCDYRRVSSLSEMQIRWSALWQCERHGVGDTELEAENTATKHGMVISQEPELLMKAMFYSRI